MTNKTKKLSPTIFGIVIFCFFLPFISVSCSNQNIATLSGIQLVTGTTIVQPGVPNMFNFNQEQTRKIKGEPLAAFALLFAIAGLVLSFLKGRKGLVATCIAGVAGLVLLLMLKATLDNEILKEGGGMLRLKYDIGFWFTLLAFLLAALWNGYLFLQEKKKQQNDTG